MRGLIFVQPDYYSRAKKRPKIASGDSRRAIIHNQVSQIINKALIDLGLSWSDLLTDCKQDIIDSGLTVDLLYKIKNRNILCYTLDTICRLSWLFGVPFDTIAILPLYPSSTAKGLRAIRHSRGLSQARLSKLSRVNIRFISHIESAELSSTPPASVSIESAAMLREYLQINIDDILNLKDPLLIRKNTDF